jgi:hypothetical protein
MKFFLPLFISIFPWISEKHEGYTLLFSSSDKNEIPVYTDLIETGRTSVKTFFKSKYLNTFSIYIHPNRHSLDSAWQKDWNMPDFKSECWMVASGVGSKLDVISPKRWDVDACEHIYSETTKTQQLITHELVHVFHGQHNVSHDFSDVNGIDWSAEGVATYASGQLDDKRMGEVKKAVSEGTAATRLDDFWTGNLRYGQSGSIVRFIDETYGRNKLTELLQYNKKPELLKAINLSEDQLLSAWKEYMLK